MFRPFFQAPQTPKYEPERKVTIETRNVSSTSGKPCTFEGGMQVAKEACMAGAVSKNPVEGCVKAAVQKTAVHTAGCVEVKSEQQYLAKR